MSTTVVPRAADTIVKAGYDTEKKALDPHIPQDSDQLRHDEAMKGLITVEGKEDVGYVSGVPEEHIKG